MVSLSARLTARQGLILVDLLAFLREDGKDETATHTQPLTGRLLFLSLCGEGAGGALAPSAACGAKRSFVRPVRDAPIWLFECCWKVIHCWLATTTTKNELLYLTIKRGTVSPVKIQRKGYRFTHTKGYRFTPDNF